MIRSLSPRCGVRTRERSVSGVRDALDATIARLEQAQHTPPLRAQELRASALGISASRDRARAVLGADGTQH